jgi:prepilin-type N-terminal cleavage/methylation domain-containing protein
VDRAQRNPRAVPAAFRRSRGFTLIELLIAVLILGILVAFASPFFMRIFRRERLRSAVQEVYSLVLAARLQAVRRNQQVVVFVDLTNRQIVSWADNLPYNYVQDAPEPTINQWQIPDYVFFRYAPSGGAVDDAAAVTFDAYPGAAGAADRIVFRPDGTIVQPLCGFCKSAKKPGTYTATVPPGSIDCNPGDRCNGIYVADNPLTGATANRNVFRISVDDFVAPGFAGSGKVSLLKWLPASQGGNAGETNYVPQPWTWAN